LGGRYSAPYGLVAPSTVFALWCRAYIERFGCNDGDFTDTLERIVVERRRYASRNPHALLRDKPLSSENYRASSLVAEPLRKADLCLESDGACAFVMVTADRARDQRKPPAFLWDTAIEVPADYFDMFLSRTELPPRAAVALLPPVLERHGLSHCDLNVLGMYDAASCNTVFDLEQLGFCPPGSAIGYLGNGHPPINTSGGMLAEIYLQGANQLIELIRQLRGESANQVPGAQLALLSGTSGMSIALLSSERPQ
jgi:acetyl-CoA acetyltransferase